jgi:hypothetical protein
MQVAWVRPGVGHWKAPHDTDLNPSFIRDGAPRDGDGAQNRAILLLPSAFDRIDDEDAAPPTAFAHGDVLMVINALFWRFKILTLDGPAILLDIDGNKKTEALGDGLLLLRYLSGLRGSSLTAGSIGTGCSRCEDEAIEAYLESILSLLDVDGNGSTLSLSDGVILLRFLFELRGEALEIQAVDPPCTRCDGQEIEDHLRGWK